MTAWQLGLFILAVWVGQTILHTVSELRRKVEGRRWRKGREEYLAEVRRLREASIHTEATAMFHRALNTGDWPRCGTVYGDLQDVVCVLPLGHKEDHATTMEQLIAAGYVKPPF